MPILNGQIVRAGAIIDVFVGVSRKRERLLQKHGFPIPQPIGVRALIDTGADVSGAAPQLFTALDLTPIDRIDVYTPSTKEDAPHQCDLYDVALFLVAGGQTHRLPDSRIVAADCWHADEGIQALIGRDILDRCYFQYHGLSRKFTLSF